MLLGSGQVAFERLGNFAIVGELSLTGDPRPIKDILAMALQAVGEGRDGLLVPTANAAEAAVVEGLNVYPVGSLTEADGFLSARSTWNRSGEAPSIGIDRGNEAPGATWRVKSRLRNRNRGRVFPLARVIAFSRLPT